MGNKECRCALSWGMVIDEIMNLDDGLSPFIRKGTFIDTPDDVSATVSVLKKTLIPSVVKDCGVKQSLLDDTGVPDSLQHMERIVKNKRLSVPQAEELLDVAKRVKERVELGIILCASPEKKGGD